MSKEEEEGAVTPKKEKDPKVKRLVKRSRTSFGPGDTAAIVLNRSESPDTHAQEKSVMKPGKEGVSSGEGSPGTSPRIRAERLPRASSPRSSPSAGRRGHDSSLTSPKSKRSHRHSANFTEEELPSRTSCTTTSSSSPPMHPLVLTATGGPGTVGIGVGGASPVTASSALSSSSSTHGANSLRSGDSSPSSSSHHHHHHHHHQHHQHLSVNDDLLSISEHHHRSDGGSNNSSSANLVDGGSGGGGATTTPPSPVTVAVPVLEAPLPPEPTPPLPRLVRVHGARNNIHTSLVPRTASSLNKNDCYILDNGSGTIFTWKGKSANMFAKSECSDVANAISQATYSGKAQIVPVEHTLEPQAFWDSLTSGRGDIADSDTTGITSLLRFFKLPFDADTYINTPENSNNAPYAVIGPFSLAEEGKQQMRPSLLTSAPICALDTGFEIIICDDTKNLPEPIPEQLLIDVARRYKRDANRPSEVRITVTRGASARHPLLTHYLK